MPLVFFETYGRIVPYQAGGVNPFPPGNEGMMCNHCKARVEKACLAVPGTTKAEVNLAEKSVTLEGTAAEAAWKKAIADAGYQVVE